jgi:hypothetical protein
MNAMKRVEAVREAKYSFRRGYYKGMEDYRKGVRL